MCQVCTAFNLQGVSIWKIELQPRGQALLSAQRITGLPSSRWEFHTWDRCATRQDIRSFSDKDAALFWLRQLITEPKVLADLRILASESGSLGLTLSRQNSGQVLEHLSWLLSLGILHAHRVPAPATAWRVNEVQPPTAAPVVSRANRSSSSPAVIASRPVEEADTFSGHTDGASTAAVLRNAAESGLPLCEECAKAAAARTV